MYDLFNISSFSMNRPWNIVFFTVAFVGCAGLAGLVGFMVAKQMAVGSATPDSAAVVTDPAVSTSSLGKKVPGQMMVDMTPDQVRAQNPNGPWMNDLVLSRGTDGVTFGEEMTVVEQAGVPSMTRGSDGTLYLVFQWFPEDDDTAFDKIAVKTSSDDGVTWTDPSVIVIDGMPSTYVRPYDPTIVLGDDGLLHLFFTTGTTKMQEISFIASAIGTDGVHYTWQDGARMDVADEPNYDAAAEFGDKWYLITPRKPEVLGETSEAFAASSDDGVTFSDPVVIEGAEGRMNWTGNMLVDNDDMLWFYGSGTKGTLLWRVSSTDGVSWSDPQDLVSRGGGDPAIVQTADGDYLLVTVFLSQMVQN